MGWCPVFTKFRSRLLDVFGQNMPRGPDAHGLNVHGLLKAGQGGLDLEMGNGGRCLSTSMLGHQGKATLRSERN